MQQTIMLNKEQKEAAEHMGSSLLIYAGAGAGKTRVIVQRIAYLIEKQGVPPYNILAITFTNKAANEMKERVAIALNNEQHGVTIRTFHSLCVLLLRRFGDKIGFDRNFIILDDDDQISVLKNIIPSINLDIKEFPPKGILRMIGDLKSEGITATDFREDTSFVMHNKEKFALIYEKYQQHLLNNNCMDFDDLILHTIHLLKTRDDVYKGINQKYQYIHVDEYQDTNKAQFTLLKLLGKGNYVCAVGDTDQAIYSWRGADIRNINEFENDFQEENMPVEVVKLTQNYRSTQPILEVANKLISHNENRRDKELWTDKKNGETIKLYSGYDDKEEANFIVREIKELVSKGKYKYSEIAVLYRINALSRYIENALVNARIPYKVIGNLSFYKRKEIKDTLAFLRLIVNPNDDTAYIRAIGSQKRGIGKTSIDKLIKIASSKEISLYQATKNETNSIGTALSAKFELFNKVIETITKRIDDEGLEEIINVVLGETEYLAELQKENTAESTSRIENLEELKSSMVGFYEDLNYEELEELGYNENSTKDMLSLYINNIMLDSVETETDNNEYVTLMSVHRAKGTEYGCVFVCAFETGIFPLERATYDIKEMEEERRLAYVAITRAKENLYITHANRRIRNGRFMNSLGSIFINEAMNEYIEDISTASAKNYYKPRNQYSSYKEITVEKEPTRLVSNNESNWKSGEKVEHEKFGKGIIVNVGSDLLTIAFSKEYGIKKILSTHIALKKI